jgi:hypothetical protein
MSDAVRKRVFIFQSPWGDDSTRAIRYVHFARNVADCQLRLGCHVIWAHDSLTWTAAHFGFSQYVDLALGMLKQGLPRSVIPHLIQLVFGKYGRLIPRNKKAWDGLERTMTFSCTVLEDPESSVGQLAKEAKDSGTSSFARLLKKANVEKPVIAMDENDTATRYPDGIDPIYGKSYDFRSEATKRWHLLVNCDAWDRAAPFLPANNDADAALEVVRAKVKASLGQTAVDLDRLIFVPDPELNQMLREVAGRYKINPADLLGHLSRFAVTTDEVVTKQGRVLLVGDEVGGDPLYRIKLPNFLPVKIGGESDRKRRRKQDTPGSDGTRS